MAASGLTASVNRGAPTTGAPFPNTVPSLPAANAGDTMADTRAWNTCQTGLPADPVCSQVPSIDVIYTDVWTDRHGHARPRTRASPISTPT